MIIKQYFGLKTIPFAKDINTKDIFISNSMKELLSRLEHIKQTRGLMLITGESGSGKSLAIRKFVQDLNSNSFFPVYIPLTTISEVEFYRQLCFKLTDEVVYHKWRCFEKIQKGIINMVTNNKKVPVIVIDEAQLLRSENLFEIQLILNFEIDSIDPVIFIMVGQTYLRDIITRPVHTSLNQRFTLKYNVVPLEKQEIKKYIEHHLNIAGCNKTIFTDSAIEAIYTNTGGNQRATGNLAIKSLTLASIEKKQTITEEEIYNAAKEL